MSDFKSFATANTAKLLDLDAYKADEHNYRSKGFVPHSAENTEAASIYARVMVWNRVLKQLSLIVAALGMLADNKNLPLTDGTLTDVTAQLNNLLSNCIQTGSNLPLHNSRIPLDTFPAHNWDSIYDGDSSSSTYNQTVHDIVDGKLEKENVVHLSKYTQNPTAYSSNTNVTLAADTVQFMLDPTNGFYDTTLNITSTNPSGDPWSNSSFSNSFGAVEVPTNAVSTLSATNNRIKIVTVAATDTKARNLAQNGQTLVLVRPS